jgi:hypothetical protein
MAPLPEPFLETLDGTKPVTDREVLAVTARNYNRCHQLRIDYQGFQAWQSRIQGATEK